MRSNKKKISQPKQLRELVNFTRIISIFFLVFWVYLTTIVFVLLSINYVSTANDVLLIGLPLPCFIVILIYLIEKDNKIRADNIQVLRELDRVKDLHDSRKNAERLFDGNEWWRIS